MEKRYLIAPHPDIELGFKRNELEYFLTFPDSGMDSDTGLIFCIAGVGDRADSIYQRTKLRPYLANKYNCVTVGINYFGIGSRPETGADITVTNDFTLSFSKIYSAALGLVDGQHMNLGDALLRLKNKTAISELDARCTLLYSIAKGEYQSFGLLPAIDHLQVLREVLDRFTLNKKRIIAFGTSYGGYTGLLLGKFAPNTFSVIIDNSGFVSANLIYIAGNEILASEFTTAIGGVCIQSVTNATWTILDETSPYFFSENCRDVRSLLRENQIAESDTRYYIFHSAADEIVPINLKEKFIDMLKARDIRVYFGKISSADIDGRIFKNMTHGMNASMRGIFDFVAESDEDNFCKQSSDNDFDLKSVHRYHCGSKSYIFNYGRTLNVSMEAS